MWIMHVFWVVLLHANGGDLDVAFVARRWSKASIFLSLYFGSRDCLFVRAPDSWSKGCEFESRQVRRENFLLQSQFCVLTFIRCPFHPRVIAVARKRPRSFCQKCRYTRTPLTQRSRSGLTMPLSRHSVGTYQETSSHATRREQSVTVVLARWATVYWSWPKDGINVRELISTLKKKKKRRRGMSCRTFSQNPRTRGKNHHHHFGSLSCYVCCQWINIVCLESLDSNCLS